MRRALNGFYGTLTVLAALTMVTAFLCVMLGIGDRQFSWGLRGLDAYAGYAIASALFLALPGTLQHGEHIRVTLVLQRLPARLRGVLEWWCLGAAAVLSLLLAYYSCRLVYVSHWTRDVSQGSDATLLWMPQLGMALGCIGLAVGVLDALVSRALGKTFYVKADNDAMQAE